MRQTIYISNYNLQPLFIFIVIVIFIIITLLIMIITTFISGSNSSNSAIISIIDIIIIFSSINKISVLLTISTSIFELQGPQWKYIFEFVVNIIIICVGKIYLLTLIPHASFFILLNFCHIYRQVPCSCYHYCSTISTQVQILLGACW